jgi:hypothetical protein
MELYNNGEFTGGMRTAITQANVRERFGHGSNIEAARKAVCKEIKQQAKRVKK